MSDPLQKSPPSATQADDSSAKNLAWLFALAVFSFLVMGYHPGLEDDAFYLAAIKRHLNPSLFPRDADFFTVQFQATIYDKLIACFVRLTHVPLAWTLLLWQFAAVFLILCCCWRISHRCFADRSAQWAAVAMIAALLTLPVSGTGINLADQYLHPRNLATAAIVACRNPAGLCLCQPCDHGGLWHFFLRFPVVESASSRSPAVTHASCNRTAGAPGMDL